MPSERLLSDCRYCFHIGRGLIPNFDVKHELVSL
jgi:hypothetical protein